MREINEEIIRYLLKIFDIEIEVVKASDMNVDHGLEKTNLMIALLKEAGAEVYLSGPSGKDYLEVEKFQQNNIELKFFDFQHPVYPQEISGF